MAYTNYLYPARWGWIKNVPECGIFVLISCLTAKCPHFSTQLSASIPCLQDFPCLWGASQPLFFICFALQGQSKTRIRTIDELTDMFGNKFKIIMIILKVQIILDVVQGNNPFRASLGSNKANSYV